LHAPESWTLSYTPASPLQSCCMQITSCTPPKKALISVAILLACVVSISVLVSGCKGGPHPTEAVPVQLPFSLAIVPGRSGDITTAKRNPNDFYVVLTNVSGLPQPVWESWNSWGYQALTFELTTTDGKKFIVSRKSHGFTANWPSWLLVEPGEHQVFAIELDESWATNPTLPWATNPTLPASDRMPITMKAIYEIAETPQATQNHVWVGRVESHRYNFTLRQW
jgi:hypothetical protein